MASTETVTVALKHPQGLRLQLCKMVPREEQGLGGSKTVMMAQRLPGTVVIKGYAQRGAKIPLPASAGEFVLTHGVSKDFMDEWLRQNHDHDLVVSGLIKISSDVKGDIKGYVRSAEVLKCGLEPIDPDKPPMSGVSTYVKDEAA